MYIPAFWVGVVVTLLAEAAVLITVAAIVGGKKK